MALIFGGAYIRRGLCAEINLRFKIDRASPIVGKKLPFLLCFTSYLRAIFQVQATGGAYIWRGDLTVGFCVTGLGAYIWRGSFLEFYGIQLLRSFSFLIQLGVHTCGCHVTSLLFSEGDIWGWAAGGTGGGTPIRVREMPVVSLMGVNCRIWFHLGCLG